MARPPAPAHEIVRVPEPGAPGRDALAQQCFALRITVFVHEQGFPLDAEIDAADADATHLLLRLVPTETPIGTVRAVAVREGSGTVYYKLSRLVVLQPYRQFGFGRALVLALHAEVARAAQAAGQRGRVEIVAHAQLPVRTFYGKYGYRAEGAEFEEDGAPHQKMVAELAIAE